MSHLPVSASRALERLLSLSSPVAIAHRGGSKLRPENTRLAFDYALTLGVDALECDVHLSRDGHPIVIHDPTLDRTTDATGPVTARTADELARVDAGYRFGADQQFPYRGVGAGVPRLSEVLQRSPGVPVIIEIKGDDPRVAVRAVEVVFACDAADRVVLAGFSHVVLATVRRLRADLVTSASRLEVQAALRRAYFRIGPRRSGFQLMQVPLSLRGRRVLSPTFVRVLRRAHIPVQAWIVDELEDMRSVLDWGVTGLISDRPDRAVEIVRALSSKP